jgi:hypothetical protein
MTRKKTKKCPTKEKKRVTKEKKWVVASGVRSQTPLEGFLESLVADTEIETKEEEEAEREQAQACLKESSKAKPRLKLGWEVGLAKTQATMEAMMQVQDTKTKKI